MWLLILVIVLIVYFYLKITETNTYWKKKGIAFVKPWPLLGNMASALFQRRAMVHLVEDIYSAYPDERYVGVYQFVKPTLLIRDPELIKTITVRQFDSFPDHSMLGGDVNGKTLQGKGIFNLSAKNGWYDMRTTLSPAFTSSKMKLMFALLERCADQFVDYFEKQEKTLTVEMKDAFQRYSNDVIATSAFGITCNSIEDETNDFYVMGKHLVGSLKVIKIFGHVISPSLMNLFSISMFSTKICKFFRNIIKETLKIREENKIIRPDIIHLLMEARKGRLQNDQHNVPDSEYAVVQESLTENLWKKKKAELTDDDITAQALIFFFAGIESTSTLMSYIAYELALNPTIQRKLREEVDLTLKECNEQLTYEVLIDMKYLDKVVSETLRKWPPAGLLDRKSLKPFTIIADKPGEKLLYLESGTVCWIPVFSIHRDSKYYPNPERFDPERFSDANKHNIRPFTYLPFGSGPRNCLGSRFALLETKLIILRILQKFEIIPVKKTQVPLKISKKTFNLVTDTGIWLGLKPRVFLK